MNSNTGAKIIITTSSFGRHDTGSIDLLTARGLEVKHNPYQRKLTEAEVLDFLEQERPIGMIAGTEPLTSSVLSHAGSYLKVISRAGTGWDNIDHETAEKRGIGVYRTPDAVTDAVAELTLSLILNLLRQVGLSERELRQGRWEKRMGSLLSGKKVGVVGCGRIGKRVGQLLEAFGAQVAFNDVCQVETPGTWINLGLKDLLKVSDIVTLHCAPGEKTGVLFDEQLIRCMKKGSWLINTSRGGLIDEKALHNAICDNHIQGAALDVFEQEPYRGPLRYLDNVILTPHIGSYARESRVRMEKESAVNLLKGLALAGEINDDHFT